MRIFFKAPTCLWPVGLCAIIAVQNARFGPIPPVFLPGINPTHHSNGRVPFLVLYLNFPRFSTPFRRVVGWVLHADSLHFEVSRPREPPSAPTSLKQSPNKVPILILRQWQHQVGIPQAQAPTRKSCRHRIGTPLTA